LTRIFESFFSRFAARRVDFRLGFVALVSRMYAAFFPACSETLRGVGARRSLALTPGDEVSVAGARFGLGGGLGRFFGPDRSAS